MPGDRTPSLLWLVLGVSFALRVALILNGGAFYWPDEQRYMISRQLVPILTHGELEIFLTNLGGHADHLGFKFVGVLPASLEVLFGTNPRIPAVFFSMFSVLNVWLVWRLARRAGAGEHESLLAAVLLALSNSGFYYARHLLPYDLALTLGLTALGLALGPASARRLWACGAVAFSSFFVYAGYWTFAGFVMMLAAIRFPLSLDGLWRRILLVGVGFIGPAALFVGLAALGGGDMLDTLAEYIWPGAKRRGEFGEGWRVPFAYFWHAEHGLALVFAASVVYAAWQWRGGTSPTRVRLWLLGAAFVYAALTLCAVAEIFVVYGRLARQLLPFFCLLAAFTLERARQVVPRAVAIAVGTALVAQAGLNARGPFAQVFPQEFVEIVHTFERDEEARYVVLFARHIYPRSRPARLPPHEELYRERHPLQYRPYQYEGLTPAARALLREGDFAMRLLRILPERPSGPRFPRDAQDPSGSTPSR